MNPTKCLPPQFYTRTVYRHLSGSDPAVQRKKNIQIGVPTARRHAVGGEYSNPTYPPNFGSTCEGEERRGRENSMGMNEGEAWGLFI
jgi:hypothetical protein